MIMHAYGPVRVGISKEDRGYNLNLLNVVLIIVFSHLKFQVFKFGVKFLHRKMYVAHWDSSEAEIGGTEMGRTKHLLVAKFKIQAVTQSLRWWCQITTAAKVQPPKEISRGRR